MKRKKNISYEKDLMPPVVTLRTPRGPHRVSELPTALLRDTDSAQKKYYFIMTISEDQLYEEKCCSHPLRYVLLSAGKKAITRLWYNADPLTCGQWLSSG